MRLRTALLPDTFIVENIYILIAALIKEIMGQCIGRGSDDPFNDIHPHIFSVLSIDKNGRYGLCVNYFLNAKT